jgi:hypothetical protein
VAGSIIVRLIYGLLSVHTVNVSCIGAFITTEAGV